MDAVSNTSDKARAGAPAERYRVQSADRALWLLELVADGPPEGLTLGPAAKQLGVSKSTAFALLKTLLARGYVREVLPGPRYQLGLSLLRLGDLVSRQLPLGDLCHPLLLELAEVTGLTSRAAVAEGGYPVFIERVDGPGLVRFHTLLGHREAPHASAAGKAVMAALDEARVRAICAEAGMARHSRNTITDVEGLLVDLERTRDRGYAIDDEEDADGVFCVGAPFVDHTGQCRGALSVTGIKVDLPSWRMQQLGATVREHADRLTEKLGGRLPAYR